MTAMAFATPHNLAALQQLRLSIQLKQSSIRLSPKAMATLTHLLKHPENTALLSITALAAQSNINPSTLTRLIKRLGFQGFADFQRLFREHLGQHAHHFYSAQASKLLSARDESTHTKGQLSVQQRFNQLSQKSQQNIDCLTQTLCDAELAAAARLLAHAKRVRTHGLRQFSALAQFFSYGLSLIRTDVGLLNHCGLGHAEALAQLEKGDVLLTASVSPYTREVLAISEQANKAGITVISLSDHHLSPLALHAQHNFVIPCQNYFYSNSISSFFVFAEGLLNQVAYELGDAALDSLERCEYFLSELSVETK